MKSAPRRSQVPGKIAVTKTGESEEPPSGRPSPTGTYPLAPCGWHHQAQQRQEGLTIDTAQQYALDAQRLIERIDLEGRERTPEEEGQIATLIAQARQAGGKAVANIEALGRAIGGSAAHGTGWAGVADAISKKQYHVEVPAEAVTTKAAPVRGKTLTETDMVDGSVLDIPAFMPLGQDRRFLYPLLNRTPVAMELSVDPERSNRYGGGPSGSPQLSRTTPSPDRVYRVCTAVSEASGRQTGTGSLDSLGGQAPRLEGGPK